MTMSADQRPSRTAKPLLGRKILITRPRERASRFAALLREEGAEPVEVPTIQIAPPASWELLDRALTAIHTYQWLIFTSVTGVQAFFERFDALHRLRENLAGLSICAIGPATADELRAHGVQVAVMPSEYRAEAVVERLSAFPLQGTRILIPRAAVARDVLPKALAARGAQVDVVEAYRTILPSADQAPDICRLFEQGAIDAVTFTSSSTVTNFVMLSGETDLAQLLRDTIVACIGPITAETARSYGLTPTIVAHEYTVPALARAIVAYYESIQKTGLRTED
jgi:uroporphyrinogen III methyltransferase/synthase